MHESDREAYMSTSDLHLDPCDGGGRIGSCTIHTCHLNIPDAPSVAATESKEQLRLRGGSQCSHLEQEGVVST